MIKIKKVNDIYNKIFIHQGTDELEQRSYKGHITRITVANKPDGLWASTYTSDSKYLSAWDKFNSLNAVKSYNGKYILFKLKRCAKVLQLDDIPEEYLLVSTEKTFKEATNRFYEIISERYPTKEELMEYYSAGFLYGPKVNWLKVIKSYDAVYLPESEVPLFGSWDVESIVIFNLDIIDTNISD